MSTHGVDAIQAYFGDETLDTITKCNHPITYLHPQVKNASKNIITDTLNWVLIQGEFTANGTEKYAFIGNFESDANTDTIQVRPITHGDIGTNYFIDDVSLIPSDLAAFAGRDTIVMTGDSIFLGREPDVGIDEACVWYRLPSATPIDTVAGFWVKPTASETYVVRQEICGNVKFDTVNIYINGVGINEHHMLEQIQVFPNPAQGVLHFTGLSGLAGKPLRLRIYNALGEFMREHSVETGSNQCIADLSGISDGYYFIELRSADGLSTRKRIIVSRQ